MLVRVSIHVTSPSDRTRQSLLLVPQSRDEDQRLDEDADRSHIGAAPPPIRPFGNTYTNQQSVQNRNPPLNSARLQNAKFGRFAWFHTESIEKAIVAECDQELDQTGHTAHKMVHQAYKVSRLDKRALGARVLHKQSVPHNPLHLWISRMSFLGL